MSFHLQIQDHPRTCGENAVQLQVLKNTTGSPPHLRGKLLYWFRLSLWMRITPAPAGKTGPLFFQPYLDKDHPRTCGENEAIESTNEFTAGSPPHLRGKPFLQVFCLFFKRITPAPAGKTGLYPVKPLRVEDHPRTCGENFLLSLIV